MPKKRENLDAIEKIGEAFKRAAQSPNRKETALRMLNCYALHFPNEKIYFRRAKKLLS
jgi:hypothetical protein